MGIKIIKSDVIWGYLGTILYSGINIILLPFILSQLTANELGLWYTFTSIGGLASLIDFGFVMTISRNVSYAWSGAKQLSQTGICNNGIISGPNIKLFSEVFKVSKLIYLITSLFTLLALSTIGTLYIVDIAQGSIAKNDYIWAWYVFIISVFLNIYFAYWAPVLKGVGAIKENYQALVLSKSLQLIISIIGLLLGFGLFAVSTGFLMGHLSYRIVCGYMFYHYDEVKRYKNEIINHRVSIEDKIRTFKLMWPNAYKQGLMSISKFMTDKFSTIICSAFLGLEVTAAYGVSMQLFGLVQTIGNIFFNTYLPLFNQLRISNDRKTAYKYFNISFGMQLVTAICGGVTIILFANPILRFIGSQSTPLPVYPSIGLFAFFFINSYQNLFVAYIITSNQMPMFKPYVICALIMVLLQFAFSILFPSWGVWSIILPMIFVELAYNGWKWPMYVFKDFQVSGVEFLRDSALNLEKILERRLARI